MKTTKSKMEASAPANVRPLSVSKNSMAEKPSRDALHNANRELPMQKVLDCLRTQLPRQYELAEVVGRWIWLDFPAKSHRFAANTLWRLGFHWNQRRCVWQHPCGAFAPYAPRLHDPRAKYGSYFIADRKAA